ncbi:AraC family transcriptional regulator ligand-binding domain-containing protein [Xanthobacter sp. KR7-225]|uniref:helix-turn-helix domain-containing protein n=1 Tax=Xanthobacter sp. KR7-225 TaxID=3156613 RepID=UPI0032B4724A
MTPYFARQSGFGPLAAILAQSEGQRVVERLCREVGVTFEPDQPNRPLAFAGMSQLFERAARARGDGALGFRVGAGMRPEEFGPLVDYSLSGINLLHAIQRANRLVALQCNAVSLSLRVSGETAIWVFGYVRGTDGVHAQHAMHALPSMVRVIQAVVGLGPDGMGIELALSADPMTREVADLSDVAVRAGRPHFAVTFPSAWLRRARAQVVRPRVTLFDVHQHYVPRLPRSTREAVSLMLQSMVGIGDPGLDEVAFRFGWSRRKIQSDLRAEGCSFRDLVIEARMTRAMAFMREGRHSLVDVALAVGYSDQAHFNRAFLAYTGLPPGRWRARVAGP